MKLPEASTLSAPAASSEELSSSALRVLENLENDLAQSIVEAKEKGVVVYSTKVEGISQGDLNIVSKMLTDRVEAKGYTHFISPLSMDPGMVYIVVMWKVQDVVKKLEEYARLTDAHRNDYINRILHDTMTSSLYDELCDRLAGTDVIEFRSNDDFSYTMSFAFPVHASKKGIYTFCCGGGTRFAIQRHCGAVPE